MTAEGILARGKENYDSGNFLDNSETLAYVETLKVEKAKKPKVQEVPKGTPVDLAKEAKNAPSTE